MNGFEPTVLGVSVYIITIAEINQYLQGLLIIATLVYTIIKISQLLRNGKN
jgi:vancomycin permeability regulator SanA